MKILSLFQKILFFDKSNSKSLNIVQFIFEALLFILIIFRTVSFQNCSVTLCLGTVIYIWGIFLSLYLAYYQATHCVWYTLTNWDDFGGGSEHIVGIWQICIFTLLFLLPLSLFTNC